MKNILILGSSGFLGFNLAKKLKKENEDVFIYGIDVVKKTNEQNKYFYIDKFRKVNLLEPKWAKAIFTVEYDIVFNFIADTGNMLYLNNQNLYNNIAYRNYILFNSFFQIITKKLKFDKLFYASDPVNYNTPYFMGRKYFEIILNNWAIENNKKVFIGRIHNTYGRGMSFYKSKISVVAEFLRIIYLSKKYKVDYLPLIGSGEQVRSFVYIQDCLNGIMQLIESDIHNPVDLTNGKNYKIQDVAEIIMDVACSHVPIKYLPSNKIDVKYTNVTNPLTKLIDWELEYDLVYGIYDLYRYLQRLGYEKILRVWR